MSSFKISTLPRWWHPWPVNVRGMAAKPMALLRPEQGQVAILLALSVLPIALVSGFAIDFQMLTTKKSKAHYSLDSAAIAGARALREGASETEARQLVKNYYASSLENTETNLDCQSPGVVIDTNDLHASTSCEMNTTLSAIAGIEQLSFNIESSTTYGIGKVDVSFVFDVSGSMGGSRISDLKAAAHDAVNTLLPEDPPIGSEDDIRIAMVSYNGAFNAGSYFENVTGKSPYRTVYYKDDGEWKEYNYHTTCVFERSGDEAFTDAPPGEDQYLMAAGPYEQNDCNNAGSPLALTSNDEPLHDYVDALSAGGNTAGHLGVGWGWYMISPRWSPYLPVAATPLDYGEPDTAKAIVLMTDGAFNTVGHYSNGNSSWQAKQMCDAIKEKDVVIYSVAFQAPEAGEDVLNYCASGADNFFDPQDGEELSDAYSSIATSISDLRITH